MSAQSKIKLGIAGFGSVGQGFYHILENTHGLQCEVSGICIKNPDKRRGLPEEIFTTDAEELLDDPRLDVLVELTDDAKFGLEFVREALKRRKPVVSTSKRMLAENLEELYQLQQEFETPLLYEGSCCASIPIIRNLEEYYDNDLLGSVEGIVNGTNNYLLSRIFKDNLSFGQALDSAQARGFAESDPKLDLDGYDAACKAAILVLHTFGYFIRPDDVFHFGIQNFDGFDLDFATKRGLTVKYVTRCAKQGDNIHVYCLPKFEDPKSPMGQTDYEYNALVLNSIFSENQFFRGKGAGSQPTGSAVMSDVSALKYKYRYEYKKVAQSNGALLSRDVLLNVYIRSRPFEEVDLSRFEKITEKYSSPKGNYITGVVRLKHLPYYKSLTDTGLSLILFDEVHS